MDEYKLYSLFTCVQLSLNDLISYYFILLIKYTKIYLETDNVHYPLSVDACNLKTTKYSLMYRSKTTCILCMQNKP